MSPFKYSASCDKFLLFLLYTCLNPLPFFNSNISDYFHDVYRISTSGWSKSSLYGYGILNSHITNTKYLIEQKDCQWLHLPDKYYKLLSEYTHEDPNYTNNTKLVTRYYENTAVQPFIVYDNVFESNQSAIIDYGIGLHFNRM